MAKVTLKELKSWREWLPLASIKVNPEQRKYTKFLILSYLQSSHPAVVPYAIYVQAKLIGYVMLIQSQTPAQWIIERLTIDKDYQRQGYGFDTVDQLIDMVYGFEKSEMVVARYDPENEAARQLFLKLKFTEQEALFRNRKVAVLEFEFEETEVEGEDEDDDVDIDVDDMDDDEEYDEDDEEDYDEYDEEYEDDEEDYDEDEDVEDDKDNVDNRQ